MTSGALSLIPKTTAGQLIIDIAKEEGIPTSGITILGGKPYVNTTGLDVKLRSKCEDEKLVHVGTEYVMIQQAAKENGLRAGGWGIVKLFDKPGFEKALLMASKGGPVTMEVINALKEMYFRVFKMRGFASPETLQMKTMQSIENIEAMAERRATNRAKREATGTGLTSVDEMDENGEAGLFTPLDTEARDIEARREGKPTDAPQGDAFVTKDQIEALKGIMEEFELEPERFKSIIEHEVGRRPKSASDVRKPEFQKIMKAFQAVRSAGADLKGDKIEHPPV